MIRQTLDLFKIFPYLHSCAILFCIVQSLKLGHDEVSQVDIGRLKIIIHDNNIKVSLLFSILHLGGSSSQPLTTDKTLNPTFRSQMFMKIHLKLSSVSVPLSRSLCSKVSRDGGFMKTNRGVRSVFLTAFTPWVSISRMQILPLFNTSSTALLLVPYMFPLKNHLFIFVIMEHLCRYIGVWLSLYMYLNSAFSMNCPWSMSSCIVSLLT